MDDGQTLGRSGIATQGQTMITGYRFSIRGELCSFGSKVNLQKENKVLKDWFIKTVVL
ncbi:hypothetical protein [Chryseobacterium takakiae]|uniref:Uncharacterized protein n=1 Tax=Chryseobacterium takakiae TaxID=1302685 RepID=A0A1M5AX83_9FLAO|nr:hypothetical protein [Chryseobacterium takakiae]SHF34820.1 hypothetical protein SAMN05444408_11577 [Chryseobacterium takakiae]